MCLASQTAAGNPNASYRRVSDKSDVIIILLFCSNYLLTIIWRTHSDSYYLNHTHAHMPYRKYVSPYRRTTIESSYFNEIIRKHCFPYTVKWLRRCFCSTSVHGSIDKLTWLAVLYIVYRKNIEFDLWEHIYICDWIRKHDSNGTR